MHLDVLEGFLCIVEGQDTLLLGALKALIGWDLRLFDFFYQPGIKG